MAINLPLARAGYLFVLATTLGCAGLDGLPGTSPDESLFDGSFDETAVVDADRESAVEADVPDTSVLDTGADTGGGADTSMTDTRPVDMGVDTRPVDMGVDTRPIDMGVDTRPVDMGVDTMPVCTAPRILCGGACLDPRTDPANCGSCNNDCATAVTGSNGCSSSTCTCPSNSTKCGADCLALSQDPTHCGGACTAAACADDRYCDGSCKCRPGLTLCGTVCVDTKGDATNCDGCGKLCKMNEDCVNGVCSNPATCQAPRTQCPTATGNSCYDLNRDPKNCGACGSACTVDEVCVAGGCVKYQPAIGCTSCPCSYCIDRSMACCPKMPGHALASCVDTSGACPLPP